MPAFLFFFGCFLLWVLYYDGSRNGYMIYLVFTIPALIAAVLGSIFSKSAVKDYSIVYKGDTDQLSDQSFYPFLPTENFTNTGTLKDFEDKISAVIGLCFIGAFVIMEFYTIYYLFFQRNNSWLDKIFFWIGYSLVAAIISGIAYAFTVVIAKTMNKEENYSIIKIDKEDINYEKLFELNKRVLESCNSLGDFFVKISKVGTGFNINGSFYYSKRLEKIRQDLLPVLQEQEFYKNDLNSLQDTTKSIDINQIKLLTEANDAILKYYKPFDEIFSIVIEKTIEKIKSEDFIVDDFSWFDECMKLFADESISINENSKLDILKESIDDKMDFQIKSDVFFNQVVQSIFDLDSNESYVWHASLEHIIATIQETPDILTKKQKEDLFQHVIFSPETFQSLILNEKLFDYPFDIAIRSSIRNNRWSEYEKIISNLSKQQTVKMLNKYFYQIEELGVVLSEHRLNSDMDMTKYFNTILNTYWNNYNILSRFNANKNFLTQMNDQTLRDLKKRLAEIERDHALMEEAKLQSKIKEEELSLARQTYESQLRAENHARVQARNSEIAADNAKKAASDANKALSEINRPKVNEWDDFWRIKL
ncbi:MAG TPA: hypothetical protein CFH82_07210 [Sulfurospirillum sp. UBA12182]|nr:MAG TPA: hypothetical protein CFH82_07210 [Sulfurospirillum sp. UBA12182]